MQKQVLQLDSRDNVLIALTDLKQGQTIEHAGIGYGLASSIPAKHKFAMQDLAVGDEVIMYGVLVGKASKAVKRGELLTVGNLHHQAAPFHEKSEEYRWTPPDVSAWKQRWFMGYHRADGQVGTRNYWLVVPLVFCENRNIVHLKQAFRRRVGIRRAANLSPAGCRTGKTCIARVEAGRSESTGRLKPRRAHEPANSSSTWTASGFLCTKVAAAVHGKTQTIFAA